MTSETFRSHETTQRGKGTTSRPTLRPRGASSRRGLAGLSLGAHALEILCSHRSLGGPGDRPDGVWVSMVLTSTRSDVADQRRPAAFQRSPLGALTPGPFMSALWTPGLAGVSPGFLVVEPGASVTGPPPPTPARRLRWGPVVRVRLRLCLESARVCLLHEDRDLLVKGCAYCTKAPPTPSTPDPRPVEPHSRAVHPDDAVSHHSDPASPLRQAEGAVLRPAYPLHRRLEMS